MPHYCILKKKMASNNNMQNFYINENEILSPTKRGIKLDVSKLNIFNFSNLTKKQEEIKENSSQTYQKNNSYTQNAYKELNEEKNKTIENNINNLNNVTINSTFTVNKKKKKKKKKNNKYNLDNSSDSSSNSSPDLSSDSSASFPLHTVSKNKVKNKVSNKVPNKVKNKVPNKVKNKVPNKVKNKVPNKVKKQILSSTDTDTSTSTDNQSETDSDCILIFKSQNLKKNKNNKIEEDEMVMTLRNRTASDKNNKQNGKNNKTDRKTLRSDILNDTRKNTKLVKEKNEEKKNLKLTKSKISPKRKYSHLSKDNDTYKNDSKKLKKKNMNISSDTDSYTNSSSSQSDTNNKYKKNTKMDEKNLKKKLYTNTEVEKIIKSNHIKLVKDNSCEYQNGVIYESLIINNDKYSMGDDVIIFCETDSKKSNVTQMYQLKKGRISGFYKSNENTKIQTEICIYYDKNDQIYIDHINKISKIRRSRESFEDIIDNKSQEFYLLGNIEFIMLDSKLIYKKIIIYNEKNTFYNDKKLKSGIDKFLCTNYIKGKDEKLFEIQDKQHWEDLIMGSSNLYYYYSNGNNNKKKIIIPTLDKLKIHEHISNNSKTRNTTKHATTYSETKLVNTSKTTTNKMKKEKDGNFDKAFKEFIKQDQEVYYTNLLNSITHPTDRAIRMMQLDVVPKYLPCREKEIKEVHGFLESGIKQSGSNQILYISGMPGTGKTATVYSVIQLLKNKSNKKLLPPFNVYEINGMNVVHPNAAYQVFYKQLFNSKPPNALSSFKIIDRLFNKNKKDNRNVSILIIDEIDYLITKTQKVLFTLFDWPTKVNSKLILIAISNTMDLPERLIPRCRSRLAFGRLVFSPYKGDEIEKIIKERLNNCKDIIDHTAIQLCARKVANVSGDIRKALQICRKAFENKRGQKIVPRDIIEATNQLFDSPLTNAINYLPWAFKMFLTCVIIELKIINEFIIPYKKVGNRYKVMIQTSGKCIGMYNDVELFKIMIDKLVKMGILLVRPYIPLDSIAKNKNKEALLGFNEHDKKNSENKFYKTKVSPEIDQESGDMGLELNVEPQLVITALMKDPECAQKLNFY
ncbi:origin recognition complex subunit 1, putative [Plasmodium yoelii]|uniref:Origin recognition complex subunit 1 n=1 Tax=Plasmodium yoelii TaxID=5861 RepID=A0A4V0KGL0_PLAYE|nr:origin recognition complex subunit 1, putative [Plasmodium yoelii]VTZ75170.1 origin recognition complex subunit 1, putative [Plasmodium yoelii]|eukprot:XP_022813127.1 origin recognition complex subunit 1, putative [Plasmodium yoelii]